MYKPNDPRELAVALMNRSDCAVQVAAVCFDKWGIHTWGWNHMGFDGFGQHAEAHCLSRANPRRVGSSTLLVAARRRRNGKVVSAKPCPACQSLLRNVRHVVFRGSDGQWLPLV